MEARDMLMYRLLNRNLELVRLKKKRHPWTAMKADGVLMGPVRLSVSLCVPGVHSWCFETGTRLQLSSLPLRYWLGP